MPRKTDRAVEIQRKYYTQTADRYDSMHANEGATDIALMNYLCGFFRMFQVRSVLDVGSATGRGACFVQEAMPDAFVCGVEPVAALATKARQDALTPRLSIVRASGESLPFPDSSFDAVYEISVLHHVANPDAVVQEMLRIARKAVFVCDSNRFGQGSFPSRVLKLLLYKINLWPIYIHLRTRGKRYSITEGDGLSYSYSIYDSYELLANWADRIFLLPAAPGKANSWFHPLLTSSAVILCAVRERT